MQTFKKVFSMFLALVMVLGLLPTTVFATDAAEQEDVVYLSVTYEGEFLNNVKGGKIMSVPVPLDVIAEIDLDEYGCGEGRQEGSLWYDKAYDEATGTYAPTALQLIIYAHTQLYGGDWGDVNLTSPPGQTFFAGGVFGFSQNLVYFLNGKFPVDREMTDNQTSLENVGATSDHIILQPGDRIDMTSFECWSFYLDDAGGFDVFVDDNDEYVYEFTAAAGEELPLNMKQSFSDLMDGRIWDESLPGVEVFYGKEYGTAEGSVFTDTAGEASVTFPEAGTYYLWTTSREAVTEEAHMMCAYNEAWPGYCLVSTPVVAKVTVSENAAADEEEAQDVSEVLNDAMAKLAATVTEPTFGTHAGEWTVFGLARGGYFDADDKYFADYYDRIVEIVNEKAATQDKGGALDRISTENSRLIVALSAIGKDATSVGNWNLITPYNSDNMYWIGKQGINGVIWSLIALDSNDYEIADPDLRQALVDHLLGLQHDDGGWSMRTQKDEPSNVDITGMTLVALYPYRDQPEVAAACEAALACISNMQQADGGFAYNGSPESAEEPSEPQQTIAGTAESCAWAIVAATTWGINPDTDPRFVKEGNSAVDNLLSYYLEGTAEFEHVKGGGANAMATDQSTYALVAYDRFINEKTALFDFSDVTFETPAEKPEGSAPAVFLGLPDKVQGKKDTEFNVTINVDSWNNEAGYKMIDFEMALPTALEIVDIVPGSSLSGGEISFHQDGRTLRGAYFDSDPDEDYKGIEMSGSGFPKNLFTITLKVTKNIDTEKEGAMKNFNIALTGMSFKVSSDSESQDSMTVVDVSEASGSVKIVAGVSFSAVKLYEGDGIDLIPENKMAVAVAVTGLEEAEVIPALYYYGTGTAIAFKYSAEITAETGIASYVAMVDAAADMEGFADADNYELDEEAAAAELDFGDSNGDGVINAQDALAAVNFWLRKTEVTSDDQILAMNVNGDSRLNTFDALGIVENFVNGNEFNVVVKAAVLTPEEAPEE